MADPHPTPKALGAPGRRLWRSVVRDLAEGWRLDARELHLLERACRIADELCALEQAVDDEGVTVAGSRGQTVAHPALSEARQLRLVQLRLLGALELDDPEQTHTTVAQRQAAKAAKSRWRGRDRPSTRS